MKKIILLSALLLTGIVGFSQTAANSDNFKVTNADPFYAAGQEALFLEISKKGVFSKESKAQNKAGEVWITFYVEADSTLTEFKVLTDPGMGMAESVIDVLKTLKFTPASANGYAYRRKTSMKMTITAH